jgi:archaemetzincin
VKSATSENLSLIQIGERTDFDLTDLIDPISARYPWIKVSIVAPMADPEEAFDSRRSQYHSTRILALLERQIMTLRMDKLLGVAHSDLYVPSMNFVFGEARLPGRVGVISTYRLKSQSGDGPDLFHERVAKEAVHEIGHMVGLKHCSKKPCVMHFSRGLSDTDLKSPDLCEDCQSHLRVTID